MSLYIFVYIYYSKNPVRYGNQCNNVYGILHSTSYNIFFSYILLLNCLHKIKEWCRKLPWPYIIMDDEVM